LLAAALGVATLAVAAPAPQLASDVIKDREGFIPFRLYKPLPGKAIGVMIGQGVESAFSTIGFSSDGSSYRYVYLPVTEKELTTNLQVPVGLKGTETRTYPRLTGANTKLLKQWNIEGPYCLVEVEVNDNLGSPTDEHFVATKLKRLDGTREYPLKLAEVLAEVRKKHEQAMQEQQRGIAAALAEEQQAALKGKKPTGPPFKQELFYVTWLPDTDRLRIHFRTIIADGAFQPVPAPGQEQRFKGTTFGVELGFAYEVTRHGKIDRVLVLPIQTYHKAVEGFGIGFTQDQLLPHH
jgi:hypothetical protein